MMRLKSIISIVLILLVAALPAAECIPEKPNPPRLVNDLANVIGDREEAQLERLLVNFNDTTSTQIAIVTVKDLCEYEASSFAFELGEKWGVGNKKFDNGVVILIKPKYDNSKGQAFIATGYGVEGVLPDAICKRIVEKEMIPAFKQNNYEKGIISAATVVMDITGGEYSAENYNKSKKNKKTRVFPFFILLIIAFFMFAGVMGRARRYSRSNGLGFWTALWLMGSMSGRHRGHYNDFTSGGGGFGGFGGGSGFGGFGGGSFGGGGAGGSW